MPFPVDAESSQVYEEYRSALGTLIGNILAVLRRFVDWALTMFSRLVTFAGEHPEALFQIVGLSVIWMS